MLNNLTVALTSETFVCWNTDVEFNYWAIVRSRSDSVNLKELCITNRTATACFKIGHLVTLNAKTIYKTSFKFTI